MDTGLPTGKFMNGLGSAPMYSSNIIAGPPDHTYYNHNQGWAVPEIREEGALPLVGNIGRPMQIEATSNWGACSTTLPTIGGVNNCTNVFIPDIYTPNNTCGKECEMDFPSNFGDKNFGFPEGMANKDRITNGHQVAAYQNVRALNPGQSPSSLFQSYEWIPRVLDDKQANVAMMNEVPAYVQIGRWNLLPQYRGLVTTGNSPGFSAIPPMKKQ